MEFGEYARAHRKGLLRFATVLTGQPWLADDIVSDVLGRAFERWPAISRTEYPHAYVRRMIVNEFLSWRRRAARVSAEPAGDSAPAAPDISDDITERDAMLRRLAALPRRQRATVVLRFYVGLTDAEIARELGCREGTVRSNTARALKALRLQNPESAGERLPARRSPA